MSEMSSVVASAKLSPSENIFQFIIGILCKGIVVKVIVDDRLYDGVVYNIDINPGPGQNYVFADVHVPALDEQADDHFFSVKVSIHSDGVVNVMPFLTPVK